MVVESPRRDGESYSNKRPTLTLQLHNLLEQPQPVRLLLADLVNLSPIIFPEPKLSAYKLDLPRKSLSLADALGFDQDTTRPTTVLSSPMDTPERQASPVAESMPWDDPEINATLNGLLLVLLAQL